MEVVVLIRCVFLHLVTKWLIFVWNYKRMQVTLVHCSLRHIGEKLWKGQVFFSCINIPKRIVTMWKMTIFITFFDIMSIFHFEFIPQGQTVSQAYYVEILMCLHETVYRKKSELWLSDWILQHDNAPAHKVLCVTCSFWPKNQLLKWSTHPTPLIWLWMTSGCVQKYSLP